MRSIKSQEKGRIVRVRPPAGGQAAVTFSKTNWSRNSLCFSVRMVFGQKRLGAVVLGRPSDTTRLCVATPRMAESVVPRSVRRSPRTQAHILHPFRYSDVGDPERLLDHMEQPQQ